MSTTDKFLRAKAFGKSYELDQIMNKLSIVLFKDEFITRSIIEFSAQIYHYHILDTLLVSGPYHQRLNNHC